MQKFQDSNLTTDLINNLLYNFWLPTYETVSNGDYIIEGEYYIYKNNVIQCEQSGYINGQYYQELQYGDYKSLQRGTCAFTVIETDSKKQPVVPQNYVPMYVKATSTSTESTEKVFVKQNDIVEGTEFTYLYDTATDSATLTTSIIPPLYSPVLVYSDLDQEIQVNGDGISSTFNFFSPPKEIDDTEDSYGVFYNKLKLTNNIDYIYTYNKRTGIANITFIRSKAFQFSDEVYIKYKQKINKSTTIDRKIILPTNNVNFKFTLYKTPKSINDVKIKTEVFVDKLRYKARFKIIRDYTLGNRYRKFTDNFISTDSYYTTAIHERLGKFVQVYSDITDVDLRPYYNFNSQKYISNIYIDKTIDDETNLVTYQVLDEETTNRTLIFPVRFNHIYTVALDAPVEVTIAPIFYSHSRKLVFGTGDDSRDISQEFIDNTGNVYTFPTMSIQDPKYIEFKCRGEFEQTYYKYRKNLYMLIQIPKVADTSVTVLEGKYKSENIEKIVNIQYIDNISEKSLNKRLTSKLMLLQINTKTSYPFSDRLIEYLFDNVIDYTWKLDGNIEKAQKLLVNARLDKKTYGVWDTLSRFQFYNYAMNKSEVRHVDICGHIDKDTEYGLLRSNLNVEDNF